MPKYKIAHTARFLMTFHTAGHGLLSDVKVATMTDDWDDDSECEGHESLNGGDMGVTVYCDGTCNKRAEKPAEGVKFIKCGNRQAHGTVPTYHTKDEVKACFVQRWNR